MDTAKEDDPWTPTENRHKGNIEALQKPQTKDISFVAILP